MLLELTEQWSRTLATSAATPASPPTCQAPEIRSRRGAAITARERALSKSDEANPDTSPQSEVNAPLPQADNANAR